MLSLFCVLVCVLAQLINSAVHPVAILLRKRRVVGFIDGAVPCYRIRPSLQSRGKKREIEMAVFLSCVPNFLIRFLFLMSGSYFILRYETRAH